MNINTRTHKILSYGNGYALLVDALKGFPREMWQFTPAPDQWSIHSISIAGGAC